VQAIYSFSPFAIVLTSDYVFVLVFHNFLVSLAVLPVPLGYILLNINLDIWAIS